MYDIDTPLLISNRLWGPMWLRRSLIVFEEIMIGWYHGIESFLTKSQPGTDKAAEWGSRLVALSWLLLALTPCRARGGRSWFLIRPQCLSTSFWVEPASVKTAAPGFRKGGVCSQHLCVQPAPVQDPDFLCWRVWTRDRSPGPPNVRFVSPALSHLLLWGQDHPLHSKWISCVSQGWHLLPRYRRHAVAH